MGKQVFGSLLILLIASACAVTAQERSGTAPADTAPVNRIVLLDPGLSLGRAQFLFPSSIRSELPFHDPSMTFPGGDWGPVEPFVGGVLEPRSDLMSPFRLQMGVQKMSPWQMVLGAVETGAVGYMAYRHIKKYGLFR